MGQVPWARLMHLGMPHTHARTGCSPSLQWLHWSAARLRRSCPALLAREQGCSYSWRPAGWGAAIWPGRPAITTTRHSTALPMQASIVRI